MAGINVSRIIVAKKCGEDFYCFLPFTTLSGGEVAVGILVACVPTLAPVFHPERFGRRAVARRQREDSQHLIAGRSRQPSHNLPPASDPTLPDKGSSRTETPCGNGECLPRLSGSKSGSDLRQQNNLTMHS